MVKVNLYSRMNIYIEIRLMNWLNYSNRVKRLKRNTTHVLFHLVFKLQVKMILLILIEHFLIFDFELDDLINCIRIHSCLAVLQWTKTDRCALVPLVWMDRSLVCMMYTLCIHNLIYLLFARTCAYGRWWNSSSKHVLLFWSFCFEYIKICEQSLLLSFDPVSVICLQLSCLFNKRRLGNRYGPF